MSFITDIWKKITSVFGKDSKADKAAKSIIHKIADTVEFALPIAQMVAKLTPTTADDAIVDKVAFWTAKVKEIGADPDSVFINGAKLALATQGVRDWLKGMVLQHGNYKIGDVIFTSIESVEKMPDFELNTIAQTAYAIWKKSQS